MTELLRNIERLLLLQAKDVLTTSECALYLGVSADRVRHLASSREIPHYKKNGKLFFDKEELKAWMLTDKVQTIDETKNLAKSYLQTH